MHGTFWGGRIEARGVRGLAGNDRRTLEAVLWGDEIWFPAVHGRNSVMSAHAKWERKLLLGSSQVRCPRFDWPSQFRF